MNGTHRSLCFAKRWMAHKRVTVAKRSAVVEKRVNVVETGSASKGLESSVSFGRVLSIAKLPESD